MDVKVAINQEIRVAEITHLKGVCMTDKLWSQFPTLTLHARGAFILTLRPTSTLSMTTNIEKFDFRNITWQIAKEFALIELDAFRGDQIINGYVPEQEWFNDSTLPTIANYAELRKRCDLFEKILMSIAREKYLLVRCDPRQRIFLHKGPEGGYVAGAQWALPKYLDLPSIPFYMRVTNLILRGWFGLKEFFSFFWSRNPLVAANIKSEYKWAHEHLGGYDTEERMKDLAEMNPHQLKELAYPKDLCYYLDILAVRSNQHKKGYGQSMLKGSLKQLAPYKAPPMLVGPAKASLLSAPTAGGFYVSIGLNLGASAEHLLPNKQPCRHAYYFGNLHSDRDLPKD